MKIISIFQDLTNMTIFLHLNQLGFMLTTQIDVSYISKFGGLCREWVFKEMTKNYINFKVVRRDKMGQCIFTYK